METLDSMDKNKSVYKLQGIAPIYCINLDGQPERWEYMENQFKYWEIETILVSLLMMVEKMI